MKACKILLLFIVCNAYHASAQWEMGFGLNAVAPLGELVQANYPWGVGGDFTLLSPSVLPKDAKLALQFGVNIGGSDNGRKSFKTNGQFQEGSLEFYNCIVSHQLATRLSYTFHPRFGLFAEGVAGHARFHSGLNETTETDDSYNYFHKTVYSNRTFRYGGALGGTYHISHTMRFDIRCDYTFGNTVEFIDMKTTGRTEDGYTFERGKSNTSDLLNIQLRLRWLLLQRQAK